MDINDYIKKYNNINDILDLEKELQKDYNQLINKNDHTIVFNFVHNFLFYINHCGNIKPALLEKNPNDLDLYETMKKIFSKFQDSNYGK